MSAARRDRRAIPNLFVVGAARAGTTSLWHALDRHPEIWMARIKEPNFFSGVEHALNPDVHDEAAYLRLFRPGVGYKLRGEASPSYLWAGGTAARIKRFSPGARILISLRDPVDRAYSGYWYRVRIGQEDRPFAEAVGAELRESRGRILLSSYYADSVGRYLETFPGAVHVLFLERLARDLQREMADVFGFLGVDTDFAGRLEARRHNDYALPRGRLTAFVHNSPRIRAALRRSAPLALRLRAQTLLLARPARERMDPDLEARLTELFAPDVERLRGLLGADLPWPRFAGSGAPEPARR